MATTDLERLIVKLDADLKSYEKALAKAQGLTVSNMRKIERTVQASANKVEQNFARIGKGLGNFAKGLGIGIGIESLRQFGQAIQQTVADAARIGDVADRIGISTDELQALNEAARGADLSFDDLTTSLFRFSKELGKAANGQGELLKLFQANNKQVTGNFSQDLKTFADLVKGAANEQEAWLIITQAMGKGAEGMIEILKGGSPAIQQLTARVKESGTAIDEAFIRKAQEIDDKWNLLLLRLGTQAKSVGIQIAENLDKAMSLEGLTDPQNLNPVIKWLLGIEKPKPQMPDLETIRAAPGAGTVGPVTKVRNPEAEAEAERQAAEAKREKAKAEREALQALEEYGDARRREASNFQNSLQNIYDETQALTLEAETIGMTTEERERYLAQQELLNVALANGIALTPDLVGQIDAAARAYGAAAAQVEKLRERQQLMTELQSTWQTGLQSLITDIAHGVEPIDALTDALKRLADQLLDIALNAAITGLFKQLAGSIAGGGIKTGPGGLVVGPVHKGGVAGNQALSRMVPASAFLGAPRFHNGGMVGGNEIPALLQKGEIVLPKGFKMGSGGDGYGRVVVNNYGGQVEQKQTRGPGGERELQLWFRASFQRELASPSTGKSLSAGYGLMPLTKRR